MSHLPPLALCLAGFAALAFATRRQQRDVVGRSLPLAMTYALRVFGAGALLLALAIVVAIHGWGIGLVMFSGHTSIMAGVVYATLLGYGRMHPRMRHR